MDTIGQFITDACVINDNNTRVTSADLYRTYDTWCKENGNHPKAARTFSRAILDRGYKRTRIGSVNGFAGLRLLTMTEIADAHQKAVDDSINVHDIRSN